MLKMLKTFENYLAQSTEYLELLKMIPTKELSSLQLIDGENFVESVAAMVKLNKYIQKAIQTIKDGTMDEKSQENIDLLYITISDNRSELINGCQSLREIIDEGNWNEPTN